ncbi:1,4-dihydroxy-2-naphthoate octaprenyltransferase [Sulfuriroseicoccus oceanibius]|uniref:1,4-dihydroxy-2-naphthoate octaprenyltransferase n=1 Tax=Sulfuriroseicoccus oceanibius TaxID=2707525 RepID=A0A6B3L8E0_9BACT|nr:1,4-dihydroxy-2-naphthoate octaprenyltransferase [Sulfuriroseicoccus oceanibius]QQL46103.1 1,4-dihydroxy-2-naphthoate octaprenyltransferase [Sulfuriroseicoccus oceanibius]
MSSATWILAARPKTLPAVVAPVWAGCVLAWMLTGEWSPWLAVCTLVSAGLIQIATNFFNDAIDHKKGADTAARLGPVRATASGLVSGRTVMTIGFVTLALACVAALPMIAARGWPVIAIGLPSLYFSFGYTGGPLPLAYRGLGELFVMIFFGLIAVMGTAFIQSGQWFTEALVLGFQLGALSTALIAINNLRDVEEDTRSNKRTLAVRLGVAFGRWEIAALYAVAFGLSGYWAAIGFGWLALATVVAVALPALVVVRGVWKNKPGRVYNKLLAICGMGMLLFAAAFQIGGLLDG